MRLLATYLAFSLALSGQVAAQGFTVSPLDPVDPVDPLDPADPDQGQSSSGFFPAIDPDIGLVQTPLPNPDSGFFTPSGDSGFVQVNPGGQDGVALVQTRNMAASSSVTAVSAASARAADFRALDRTIGQTTDFAMAVGETIVIGRLAIRLEDCRYPVDNPASDAFAHLAIADLDGRPLFDGWMVASSPALMALEHPRYDVWVLNCRTS